jgi:hypothetical protein
MKSCYLIRTQDYLGLFTLLLARFCSCGSIVMGIGNEGAGSRAYKKYSMGGENISLTPAPLALTIPIVDKNTQQ